MEIFFVYFGVYLMVVGVGFIFGLVWLISLGCRKPKRRFNRSTRRFE